jgi:nicotinamidase-related amidase
MDMQNGIVARFAEGSEELLSVIASVQGAARAAKMPIIYVRVAFRDGAPEANPKNQSFSVLAGSSTMSESADSTQVHARLAPIEGEVTVTKRRVSAFAGSDLDVVLRSLNVDSLVLCGIATSGVVLSTTRQAADLDFKITILSDACADADPEVHRVLMEKVFPRQASVVTTAQWIEQLD